MIFSIQIQKVANGYMVMPALDLSRDYRSMCSDSEIHVFPTWTEASKWLRDAFEVEPPKQG